MAKQYTSYGTMPLLDTPLSLLLALTTADTALEATIRKLNKTGGKSLCPFLCPPPVKIGHNLGYMDSKSGKGERGKSHKG